MKKANVIFSIIFFIALILPILDAFFNFSPVKNLFEKRQPTDFPNLPQNQQEAKNYPRNFENYFNDNYGFRKSLIWLNSEILDRIFNQSPSQRALIGKDGWLYFDNYNSLLDAQGLAKISQEKIDKMVSLFLQNQENLAQKNIDYLLVIAADKSSIYPEFLPDYIKTRNDHRIDKFLSALRKKSPDFPVLDLRPILLEAKENEIIYHQTDTHWNRRGAHYGYVAIMKKLGLKYNSRQEFEDITRDSFIGDISHIMNLQNKNIDYDLREKFTRDWRYKKLGEQEKLKFHKPNFLINNNKNLPILFVYKDSFFDNLLYFFAQNFSRSYFINEFPCELDLKVIEEYKPDYVIQEFWEGRIEEIADKC